MNLKRKKRIIRRASEEEIDWLVQHEYRQTHNRESKSFIILEAMVLEILEKRKLDKNTG